MTVTSDRLSEIARSLNRLQWQPTAEEVAFGGTLLRRMGEMEEDAGLAFPRGTDWWQRLHTESFAVLARVVAVAQGELSAGRRRLADSPMVELVELYISAAQPLLPHAERMLAAWRDAAPPAPAADEIALEAARLNISAEQAEARLRFGNASRWEQESSAASPWNGLRPAWALLGAVRSTMTAAVTGDTDY